MEPSFKHDAGLPPTLSPYFLSAHEGERLASYQTMFTYLSRPANTGSNYFAVHTKGAKSPYIPLHFHSEHTENFICTEGRMWLYANGREVLGKTPGGLTLEHRPLFAGQLQTVPPSADAAGG